MNSTPLQSIYKSLCGWHNLTLQEIVMKNKLITFGMFIGPVIAILYLILLLLAMLRIYVTFGINSSDFQILLFIILIGASLFSLILNVYAFIVIRCEKRKFLKRY